MAHLQFLDLLHLLGFWMNAFHRVKGYSQAMSSIEGVASEEFK